jgi:hypothetical protein
LNTQEKLMFTEVQILITHIRAHLDRLHHDESGYSTTEVVVYVAAFLAIALLVAAALTSKIKVKVNGIDLGG